MNTLEEKGHGYDDIYLPEEIIWRILLNINAEDLHSFKFVSKLWCSLISNQNFVNAHLNLIRSERRESIEEILFKTSTGARKRNHYSISVQKDVVRAKELQFPHYIYKPEDLSLEASCDGLLLYQDHYNDAAQFYIFNPVTALLEPLPRITYDCCSWVYGYNHDCLTCRWALAFDTCIKKYKVFGIINKFQFIVLTLVDIRKPLSNCWKALTIRHNERLNFRAITQVLLLKEELQWMTEVEDPRYREREYQYFWISSINIKTLEFSEIKIPPHVARPKLVERYRRLYLLSEVRGSLCLTIASPHKLKMFVLEDKHQCLWSKSQRVLYKSLSNLTSSFGSFVSENICLVAMRGDHSTNLVDLVKVLINNRSRLFIYDLKSQELKSIGLLIRNDQNLLPYYYFHLNSLVSCD